MYIAQNEKDSKRKRYEALRSQLDQEAQSFIDHWRDLANYTLPRRARFVVNDPTKGAKKNQKIIDSTATNALKTLRSGMMSGVTSPARPWFRLMTPDTALSEIASVKDWLHEVTQSMTTIFSRCNLYNSLPIVYGDMGLFGTAALYIEEDPGTDVIRTYAFPVGTYRISTNGKGIVDVFMREFQMTVRQLVEKFGERDAKGQIQNWENFSDHVKQSWTDNLLETWVDVVHVIAPNPDYNPKLATAPYKRYASCYFERGNSSRQASYLRNGKEFFLRESGYDLFPVLVPRWEVSSEDAYGTDSPGMTCLGDVKQLQHGEKKSMQVVDKQVDPPMTGPSALRFTRHSILPGDTTYLDVREGQQGFRPIYEVRTSIQDLEMKQEQVRGRIRRAYYEDLFLMLTNSTRREITAREIDERHEEKLLALGPVLEQLNQDLLDPLIDLTFDIMVRRGLIPEPPQELAGQELRVEYISVMAQAQKLVAIGSIERLMGFGASLVSASQNPEVLDKIDFDQAIDEYALAVGTPPRLVRPDDDVAKMRDDRARARAAQMQSEALKTTSESAKNLSAAKTDGGNALSELLRQARAGAVLPAA